ncbi:MAG: stage II sporulation protein M [Pseudomonadales bacterium]
MSSKASEETQQHWHSTRLARWSDWFALVDRLERHRTVGSDDVRQAMRIYPDLARELVTVRRNRMTGSLPQQLEAAYARLHRMLYQPPADGWREVLALVRLDVPRILWGIRRQLVFIMWLFLGSILAGWWLIRTYPELISLLASEEMVNSVQEGRLWTDDLLNVMPSALLSVGIFTNNIVVALTAIGFGIAFGIGSLYIVVLNGFMLGGIFAFTAQYDLADRLLQFVTPHGIVELSAILLCGAAGFHVGESLANPGQFTRGTAFRVAMGDAMRLGLVCVVFLVGCGLIEGFISPDENVGMSVRVGIGVGYFLVFVHTLSGWPSISTLLHALPRARKR